MRKRPLRFHLSCALGVFCNIQLTLSRVFVLSSCVHESLLLLNFVVFHADRRFLDVYIAELRLRHVEPDFAISPALDRAFKKVNDAVTRGFGPVKKAPEVKLLAIETC